MYPDEPFDFSLVNDERAGICGTIVGDTPMAGLACSLADSGSIVGRTAEWRSMSAFLDTALRDGGALIVTGELGSGRTAMLTPPRADAQSRGARVLHAAGAEGRQMGDHVALGRLLEPVRDRL